MDNELSIEELIDWWYSHPGAPSGLWLGPALRLGVGLTLTLTLTLALRLGVGVRLQGLQHR